MDVQASSSPTSRRRSATGSPGPNHPDDAVRWLAGTSPSRVLVLDGSEQLSAQLCDLGHDVVAAVPDAAAVASLTVAAPDAHPSVAIPQALPLASGSVDVVVVEEAASHADDLSLAELARVLRPGGVVATIRTTGDRKVPWVKKVYALAAAGSPEPLSGRADADLLAHSDLFEIDATSQTRHWETFRRGDVVDFVVSYPREPALEPADRERLTIAAEELYDGYGRGPDGLSMPWLTSCRRAKVAGLTRSPDDEPTARIAVGAAPSASGGPVTQPAPVDDGLLIDFR